MVPAPMTPTRAILRVVDILAERHLRRLALGEEQMSLRPRLIAGDELQEQLALRRQGFVERQREGIANRLRAGDRRFETARLFGEISRFGVEGRRGRRASSRSSRSRTGVSGPPSGDHCAGEMQRLARPDRHRRRHRPGPSTSASAAPIGVARDDHAKRLDGADQTRQPHRAAAARQQAEFHFGQAELGALIGDAEMAAERQFQPAAERRAVDGRDGRLGDRFQRRDDGAQLRLLHRLAEFGDVGAGDEGPSGAGDDDGRDGRIVAQRGQRLHQRLADMEAQRVDRRIVDGDDCDVVLALRR